MAATGTAVGVPDPLWTFLTALSGVTDEPERARLIATGLPSLVQRCVSGTVLLKTAYRTIRNRFIEAPAPSAEDHILLGTLGCGGYAASRPCNARP